jgi:O-methyltransferase
MMLVKRVPYDPQKRENGRDWPCFGYSMAGLRRLDNLQFCVDDALKNNVPGDLIETGVWRGGSVILMRAILKQRGVTDRIVWAADSFEGMPRPDGEKYPADSGADLSDIDFLSVSLEQVKANFARFGLLDDQVRFLKGWFRDTLPDAPIERLAVLRLDGDLYESTMDSLNALYQRISPGGYVIVDDYWSWPMCRQAVTDYLAKHNITANIKPIDKDSVYWQVAPRD